jgi:hypothetical protein
MPVDHSFPCSAWERTAPAAPAAWKYHDPHLPPTVSVNWLLKVKIDSRKGAEDAERTKKMCERHGRIPPCETRRPNGSSDRFFRIAQRTLRLCVRLIVFSLSTNVSDLRSVRKLSCGGYPASRVAATSTSPAILAGEGDTYSPAILAGETGEFHEPKRRPG